MTEDTLANVLKSLRKDKGLSLADLATMAGVSAPYLSQLERGEARNPSVEKIRSLAHALQVPTSTFVETDSGTQPASTQLPDSLKEFQAAMKLLGETVSDEIIDRMAKVKLRGPKPQTVASWNKLYKALILSDKK